MLFRINMLRSYQLMWIASQSLPKVHQRRRCSSACHAWSSFSGKKYSPFAWHSSHTESTWYRGYVPYFLFEKLFYLNNYLLFAVWAANHSHSRCFFSCCQRRFEMASLSGELAKDAPKLRRLFILILPSSPPTHKSSRLLYSLSLSLSLNWSVFLFILKTCFLFNVF